MTTHSFRAQLGAFLKANPRTWVKRAWIADIGGEAGYRQRLSELRAQGMVIECLRERSLDGVTLTWYRYLPTRKG